MKCSYEAGTDHVQPCILLCVTTYSYAGWSCWGFVWYPWLRNAGLIVVLVSGCCWGTFAFSVYQTNSWDITMHFCTKCQVCINMHSIMMRCAASPPHTGHPTAEPVRITRAGASDCNCEFCSDGGIP